MGRRFDSAITRVRPFFQSLLRRDPSGVSWLPALLRLGQANPHFGQTLARHCGPLLDWVSRRHPRSDRALRCFGIPSVELEQCFEYRLPPTQAFLRWLIEHPSLLTWPRDEEMSAKMRLPREELLGRHGQQRAAAAKSLALTELERTGAAASNGKWWAFEGFTQVDCLLETQTLMLLVEGKRTEPVASSTRWLPQRNQLLRTLEVAAAVAHERGKEFAVVLMAEEYVSSITFNAMLSSLPHLSAAQRSELTDHYLGCVTWSQALSQMFFPHTVEEAALRIRESAMVPMIA